MATGKRIRQRTRAIQKSSFAMAAKERSSPKTLDQKSKIKRILKKRNILIFLAIVIVIGSLYYLKGLFIAAIVNGQPITRLAIIKELEKRNGKQLLSSIVSEALILQEAQKRNVTVSQKEIDDSVKSIEKDLKERGQNLDQALTFQGMSRKDFEYQLRLRKLVEKMLAKEVKPTDKEINDYIEQNKDSIPKDMSEEEIKQTAKEQLTQQKLSSKVQEWLADLQKNASINYFVSY